MLSISHRITGVFLSAGAVLLCCWLVSVAAGAEVYAVVSRHVAAWYGQVVVIGFVFSLYPPLQRYPASILGYGSGTGNYYNVPQRLCSGDCHDFADDHDLLGGGVT